MIQFKNLPTILLMMILTSNSILLAQVKNAKLKITYIQKRKSSENELKRIQTFPKLLKDRMMKQIKIGEKKNLFIDPKNSLFTLANEIQTRDSSFESTPEEEITRTTYLTTTDYYKRAKDKALIIRKNIKGDEYIIKTGVFQYDWEITTDSKIIQNYNCFKARAKDEKGREVTAWFTKEIPISNGPEIYGGLPGLILELDSKYKSFALHKIENWTSDVTIKLPPLLKSISMKEFKKQFNSKNNQPKVTRYKTY